MCEKRETRIRDRGARQRIARAIRGTSVKSSAASTAPPHKASSSPLLLLAVAVAQTRVCPGWLRRFRDGAELHRV
jgi:hypothetical protein